MEGLIFSKSYAFEPGGPKRLQVRHTFSWDQVDLRADGHDLGMIDPDALKDGGVDCALHDGTLLRVWTQRDFRGRTMFFATRDGKPLAGTGADPNIWIHPVAGLIVIAGVVQLALGIGLIVTGRPAILLAGVGLGLTALGCFAWRGSFGSLLCGGIVTIVEIVWALLNDSDFHGSGDWLRLGVALLFVTIAFIRALTVTART